MSNMLEWESMPPDLPQLNFDLSKISPAFCPKNGRFSSAGVDSSEDSIEHLKSYWSQLEADWTKLRANELKLKQQLEELKK